MSKIKLSFSFLLTLLLVGMFSAIAFAAAPTAPNGLKATVNADHTLTLTWNAVAGADTYNVILDGTTLADSTGLTATTYTFNPAPEENYSIVVEAVNTDGTTPSAEFAWNADMSATQVASDTDNDNGMVNANQTGVGVGGQSDNFANVIKSNGQVVSNQDGTKSTSTTHRTHGEYQNNTNSCASCHQTHTAASKNLLFKNGVYATCTACHDGTLGFYNVFATGAEASKSAGTFGGTHDGNMSIHLANGAVSVKAAPGGNRNSADANWTAEFTCASCHAPHGSYSARLLHFNPNDMGNLTADKGGKRVENVPVVADTAGLTDAYIVKKITLADPVDAVYSAKGLVAGDVVFQLMKYNGTTYVNDTDPWLHGYDFDANHNKTYWTSLNDSTAKSILNTDSIKDMAVKQGNGFMGVKSASVYNATTNPTGLYKTDTITIANISRAYIVKLDLVPNPTLTAKTGYPMFDTQVNSLWDGKDHTGATWKGNGIAISNFCSSCHTDYLAHSGSESGKWNQAYRHSTDSDTYTCVRCHYPHGTDVTVMKDSEGKTVSDIVADTTNYFPEVTDPAVRQTTATDYMMDKDPSSALKRFTNMAVCWGCHTSSHSEGFRNGSTFEQGSGTGGSHDYIGLPTGN